MRGCGAFGKLPCAGDFIRFDLPADFVEVWDTWLQGEIAAARDQWGARWQGCYMSAPIWRFSIAPAVAGGHGMIGILMASVDRVGRQFPLTLATVCPAPHGAVHLNARAWFERLEDIALAALDDLPLEALKGRLAGVAPPVAARVTPTHGGSILAGAEDLAPALGTAPAFAAPAVWSARTESDMRLMSGTGLPQGGDFAALFDLDAPVWQVAR